ncbi:hypothetical protein V6N13_109111 [Hibiscus sabdariffa]
MPLAEPPRGGGDEVPVFGGSSLLLTIKISNDRRARASLAILGKKVTSIHHFNDHFAHRLGRLRWKLLRRRRHGIVLTVAKASI